MPLGGCGCFAWPRMTTDVERDGGGLGMLLRDWRRVRDLSQFDLALEAKASQRHPSFIKTGRSAPSRDTLGRLADALRIPFRDCNPLVLAAGYAPDHAEDRLDQPEMRQVTRGGATGTWWGWGRAAAGAAKLRRGCWAGGHAP